jgi:predicted phage-related endonuclease
VFCSCAALLNREALEQQLKQTEAASTEQLQSARQAAVNQAVQHSNQYQADLERAAGQRKQLQQQVQELQAALAAKESELAAVQMQLAAALDSAKRVQENHGKVSCLSCCHHRTAGLWGGGQQQPGKLPAGKHPCRTAVSLLHLHVPTPA